MSDFCTDYEGSRNIADRIISDWKDDLSRHNKWKTISEVIEKGR